MSQYVKINPSSLQTIRQELDSTFAQSASDFEVYLADNNNLQLLESSRGNMAQIGGIFRLLQFPGAALLADEMAALIAAIIKGGRKSNDAMIGSMTQCYFILPRYIEYIAHTKMELPIVILAYVNELRASQNRVLLPEYHFYQGTINVKSTLNLNGSCEITQHIATISRLRHMYQVGLLGVINEPQSWFHYGLMARAVTRICSLMGDHANSDIWQLAGCVLECFADGKLEPTMKRRRCFADLEKLMRVIVSKGQKGLDQISAESLKKDMVFMLMLSSYTNPIVDGLRKHYAMPTLTINDDDIAKQRRIMLGPNQDTIESVIKVLKEELRNSKDILEIASQNDGIEEEDLVLLQAVIQRVADTMGMINLHGPQKILAEQLGCMTKWSKTIGDVGSADFLATADAVLFVESALSGLDRRELTIEDLNEIDELSRRKIISSSHLAEARLVVIEESQSGIALAKRAITSYVESNFDIAHISNVATTLSTVRGGLHMLKYARAAAVLKSCADFMQAHVKKSDPSSQRHQLLETLADALISLEYYLKEVELNGQGNEKILEVAEDSLAALGFAVSK